MNSGGSAIQHRFAPTEELDRKLLSRLNLKPEDLTPATIAKIWKACALDEDFFVFGGFVRTKDEHDAENSIKPMPEKPHLKELLAAIRESPILLVSKSRQMQITWTLCAHAVWRAKFHRNRFIFFQSKREQDAANLVYYKDWANGRASFIEMHLPDWMRTYEAEGTYSQIFYPNGSRIWGIPQGPHMMRSYTATEVIMDEAAFWDAFEASYQAALATVKGGGNLVAVTTAKNATFFAKLIGEYESEER